MQRNNYAGYKIIFTMAASKEFKKLNKRDVLNITKKLDDLIGGAKNLDIKKLTLESASKYRLRVGEKSVYLDYDVYESIFDEINQLKKKIKEIKKNKDT